MIHRIGTPTIPTKPIAKVTKIDLSTIDKYVCNLFLNSSTINIDTIRAERKQNAISIAIILSNGIFSVWIFSKDIFPFTTFELNTSFLFEPRTKSPFISDSFAKNNFSPILIFADLLTLP